MGRNHTEPHGRRYHIMVVVCFFSARVLKLNLINNIFCRSFISSRNLINQILLRRYIKLVS